MIYLLLIAVVAGLAVAESRRLLGKHPDLTIEKMHERCGYLAWVTIPTLLGAVTLLGANSFPEVAWKLPLGLQFYSATLIWGALFAAAAFVFSLGISLSFRLHHPSRYVIVLVASFLGGSLFLLERGFSKPVAPQLMDKVDPFGVVLQTSGSSDAPATGANIARFLGVEATEKEVAELMRTTVHGTSTAHVVFGLEKLGISCRKVESETADPGEVTAPAILFVDRPGGAPEAHAVAFLGERDGQIYILDPSSGFRVLDLPALRSLWRGGRAIECSREGVTPRQPGDPLEPGTAPTTGEEEPAMDQADGMDG